MVTTVREIERKYDLSPDQGVPDFASLAGLSAEERAADEQLEAVYFDTIDRRLATAGITLRRRTGGADAGWHLKIPAGQDTRDEIRAPLGESPVAGEETEPAAAEAGPGAAERTTETEAVGWERVPADLLDRVLVHTRGAELRPIARIRTHRARWLLRDAGGSRAELVLDSVSGQRPGTQAAWQEIEVELLHGDGDLLERVDGWLAESGIHRSRAGSKLARLLGDAPPRRPAESESRRRPRPGTAAGRVVRAYLADQLDLLRRHDPEARADAPDAVHQMRVTTRRLRSALRTYRRQFDRDRAARLGGELAWLAGVLGAVRDAEVQSARFGVEIDELGCADGTALGSSARDAHAAIAGHFAELHAAAFRELRRELSAPRYFALLDELADLVTAQPTGQDSELPARVALPQAVARTDRRLHRAVAAVESATGGDRDLAIHEARKIAKRARYAAELAAVALGKDAKRFAKQMKSLQEVLGEHQDSVVTREEIRRLRQLPVAARIDPFVLGVLYGRQLDRAAAIEDALPERWRQVSAGRHRRWLP